MTQKLDNLSEENVSGGAFSVHRSSKNKNSIRVRATSKADAQFLEHYLNSVGLTHALPKLHEKSYVYMNDSAFDSFYKHCSNFGKPVYGTLTWDDENSDTEEIY